MLKDIKALVTKLAAIDFSQSSEQATREMAVNPVIDALGWNTFNPDEVAREYSVLGGRVDYCLRWQERNLVLIEVKRTGTDLSEHQEQLLRYAFDGGVRLAALTDGLVWWLYLPMVGGDWEQRRFFQIDFRKQTVANAASAIHRFLNHDRLVDGTALREAQQEFESQERDRQVRAVLQDAWRRVLNDPQSLLRDLLSEAVQEISGHTPDRAALTEFLRGISGSGNTEGEPPVRSTRGGERRPPRRPGRTDRVARGADSHRAALGSGTSPENQGRVPPVPGNRKQSVPPVAFRLDGKRYEVGTWRELLVRLCEQLSKEVGSEGFAERVVGLRGRIRPYFSSSPAELRMPLQISGTDLHVEGNISAATAERIARRTLRAVRGSDGNFSVELAK